MRCAAPVLAALLLAGCAGGPSEPASGRVLVRNGTDGPTSVSVVIVHAVTRAPEFEHTFLVVHPGDELHVAHAFDGAPYLVNVSAFATSAEFVGEERLDVPDAGEVEIHLLTGGRLSIRALART